MVWCYFRKRMMLLQAFRDLPDDALDNFRFAYIYRSQFDDLAESGSAEDAGSGLVAAVIRALALGTGFRYSYGCIKHDMGIDAIPDSGIESYVQSFEEMDDAEFRTQLYDAATKLSGYNVQTFFDSLKWFGVDYKDKAVLRRAVEESLLNYARTAMLGANEFCGSGHGSHCEAPASSRVINKETSETVSREKINLADNLIDSVVIRARKQRDY